METWVRWLASWYIMGVFRWGALSALATNFFTGKTSHVRELACTDHSPFPVPSTLLLPVPSGLLLAAAEAKLDVRGEGILRIQKPTYGSRHPRRQFLDVERLQD
jgi:hypothetical protein